MLASLKAALCTCLLLLLIQPCQGRFKEWRQTVADPAGLDRSGAQKADIITRSETHCMNRAATLDWVYAVCYIGGHCMLWGLAAAQVFTWDTSLQDSACKVLHRTDGCVRTDGSMIGADSLVANAAYPEVLDQCLLNGAYCERCKCKYEDTYYEVGDSIGCLLCTDIGVTYGDDNSRLVTKVELPENDTCCSQAAEGYCLVAECSSSAVSFCEAKARCEARGLPVASRSLYENSSIIGDTTLLGTAEQYFYVNVHREDGVWRWLPDMSELDQVKWVIPPQTDDNCAEMRVDEGVVSFYPVRCSQNDEECIFCYDPNTSLPPC